MKKVLLVAINARYSHTNLALLYINRLSRERTDSRIIEFIISEDPLNILNEICSYNPEVIAFSVYIWNARLVRELIPELKKIMPTVKLILGGPEVSYNPQIWLSRYPTIDYIISGGGEHAWWKLLEDEFQHPERVINIPNYPLTQIPFPYKDVDLKNFRQKVLSVRSHLSLNFSSREEVPLEYRSYEQIRDELSFFIDKKIPLVKFVDRTFNSNVDFAREIWNHIGSHSRDTRFHFEINPLLITREDIALLKEIPQNLFQFEVGIQSTNSNTLREINRQGEWEKVRENVELLIKETSIPVHLDLIFGLPYETVESAQRSFNDVYSLKPDHFQPGMLKVLPGTVMAEKAAEYDLEYQEEPPYRILSNRWITFSELYKLQSIEHLVNNLYNSHRFIRTVEILENIFSSPFEVFAELLSHWEAHRVNSWQKDWVKTAALLAGYLSKKLPEQYALLLDALRWDLCSGSGLQYYPELLLNDSIAELRFKWRKYLRHNIEELCREFKTERSVLHKAMVFRTSSEKFKERCDLTDNTFLLFLNCEDRSRKEFLLELTRLDTD